MARGSVAKSEITEVILNTFEGAFINDKEIRIPWNEAGETVEIKITMTCAKENIGGSAPIVTPATSTSAEITPPSDAEIQQVRNLIEKLNL